MKTDTIPKLNEFLLGTGKQLRDHRNTLAAQLAYVDRLIAVVETSATETVTPPAMDKAPNLKEEDYEEAERIFEEILTRGLPLQNQPVGGFSGATSG